MPAADINYVDPLRFEAGSWSAQRNRQIGEGDIFASYSADCIGMGKPVRKPFVWRGMNFVNTCNRWQGGNLLVTAYRLIHPSQFDGEQQSYGKLVSDAGSARSNPMGFYHGVLVQHAGQTFVLSGMPILFAPGQAEQFSLF